MPPGLSSAMTMKRIQREIIDLQKEDKGEIALAPMESNLHVWKGSIPGPEGSVYEGGVFNVEINLPQDYPFSAPRVLFKTRIYHMNISEQGNICIDILKGQWSPALSLFKVMLSLSSLLTDPNPKDPLVPSIATQYSRSRKQHDATARQWTEQYAQPPKPPPAPIVAPVASEPKTTKARGKKRADAEPEVTAQAGGSSSNTNSNTRASRSTVVADEVIVLDSDVEEAAAGRENGKGKKRKRAAPSGTSGSGDVVEVIDSDEEEGVGVAAKKPRSRKPPSKTARTTGAGASGSGSGARRSARHQMTEDVIVIEDD